MTEVIGEKSKLEWYAVKLIYEFIITGKPDPERIDDDYNTLKPKRKKVKTII